MVRRWGPALVCGGVWWWAVLRLVLDPADAGLVEGAVVAGGWGLSLLPVHVAATAGPARAGAGGRWGAGVLRGAEWVLRAARGRGAERGVDVRGADGAVERRRGTGSGSSAGERGTDRALRGAERALRATRAWLRRRSGGGSGRS
ncbi:hypothetical protein AB0467_21305 [Streptomyces sp. NPDC052095]|uniref:hypothetical protein n=1 Tax=unclassified Streptomyces TaxID=2593676 RepID=UPI00344E30C1